MPSYYSKELSGSGAGTVPSITSRAPGRAGVAGALWLALCMSEQPGQEQGPSASPPRGPEGGQRDPERGKSAWRPGTRLTDLLFLIGQSPGGLTRGVPALRNAPHQAEDREWGAGLRPPAASPQLLSSNLGYPEGGSHCLIPPEGRLSHSHPRIPGQSPESPWVSE